MILTLLDSHRRRERHHGEYAGVTIAEGGFVGLALGRRNYVGCRGDRGLIVETTFYTVFESARGGATPDEYIRYAAEALLDGRAPLLPHEWVEGRPA